MPETVATGRTSVAPYGLCKVPLTRIDGASAQREAGTAAPAQRTRCREGSVRLWARQWSKIFRQSVGEPKELVTFSCVMAWMIFLGSTEAGREGSISGTMVVMPSAGLNRAKIGSIGRSTSPGLIP